MRLRGLGVGFRRGWCSLWIWWWGGRGCWGGFWRFFGFWWGCWGCGWGWGRGRVLGVFLRFFQFLVVLLTVWLAVVLVLGNWGTRRAWLALPLAFGGWVGAVVGLVYFFRPAFRRRDIATAARMIDSAV